MAALVVVSVPQANGDGDAEARVDIFPGGATTAIHPADTAFWIGYGFAAEVTDSAGAMRELGEKTRFELDVDGAPTAMRTDVRVEAAPLRKTDLAEFPAGLPAGWHEFVGRWYDRGKLILSSRASIEFVER
ncbi:MAG: hypothetical protein ACRDOF_07225 [Gaiellaceae bacterium]